MNLKLAALSLLIATSTMAQEENTFNIDAQVRARGEYNNGAVTPRAEGERPAFYINERARVSLGYQRKYIEMKASFQHTGVWGQDNIKERAGRVAMNEAWAKVNFGKGFFAQVGRQQLAYDDERILGNLDWNVAGNWHDALRLGYDGQQTRLHAILAFNQNKENVRGCYYDAAMPYKSMQTLWFHQGFYDRSIQMSLLLMNVGREGGTEGNGKTRYMQTIGTHLTYDRQDIEAAASFYFQTGKNPAGTKVAAYMFGLQGAYRIQPNWKVRAGYDHLSGNDGRNINQHSFDPLYGTHHNFYGAMDYFTGPAILGLQDIHAGTTYTINRLTPDTELIVPVNIVFDYHYLLSAEKFNNLSKSLGHEFDLKLSCKPLKDLTLSAGYSFMLGTESMDVVKGGNHKSWQDWAWLSLNISPRIFSTKW